MPYFAKINEENIVVDVVNDIQENVDAGIHGDPSKMIETDPDDYGGYKRAQSMEWGFERDMNNPAARKNFAQPGFEYNPEHDFFSPGRPYPSWQLDLETGWYLPPVAPPDGVTPIDWDEENQRWILPDE